MNFVAEHRLGRFSIPIEDIRKHPHAIAKLFEGLIVIRAEGDFAGLTVEYTAYGEQFEVCQEGSILLKYDVWSHSNNVSVPGDREFGISIPNKALTESG